MKILTYTGPFGGLETFITFQCELHLRNPQILTSENVTTFHLKQVNHRPT